MSRKSNSKVITECDIEEAMDEYNLNTLDPEVLYEENIKLKAVLARYGLSIDNTNFSEVEILCTKQIDKFKRIFETIPMSKRDTEALEKLHNILSKEQEKEKAKEKVQEKSYTIAELTSIAKQNNGK